MAGAKFIHKYKLDNGMAAYVPSEDSKRPFTKLWSADWEGKGSGGAAAINQLEKLNFSKEEKEPALEPVMASITGKLDAMANEIQKEDPVIAKAIDKISDILEK